MKGSKEVVIVGCSQGGVRAMAYASRAFERPTIGAGGEAVVQKVRAVVTIGSPIEGHLTVENAALSKMRFNRFRARLADGIFAGSPLSIALSSWSPYVSSLVYSWIDQLAVGFFGDGTLGTAALDSLTRSFMTPESNPMIYDCATGVPPESSKAVWDFDRNSSFHKTYIVGEDSLPQAPETRREPDGYGIRKIKKFPYFEVYQKYRYYTFTPPPKLVPVPLFSSEMYYANIVGTQHDLDAMLKSAVVSNDITEKDYQGITAAIEGYRGIANAFGIVNAGLAAAFTAQGLVSLASIFGAGNALVSFYYAGAFALGAVYNYDGRKAMNDRSAEFGVILGSSKSDTFIQSADQDIPQALLGAAAINVGPGSFENGRAEVFANHASETYDPVIWGQGKKFKEPLANYLQADAPPCLMKDFAKFLDNKGVDISMGTSTMVKEKQ